VLITPRTWAGQSGSRRPETLFASGLDAIGLRVGFETTQESLYQRVSFPRREAAGSWRKKDSPRQLVFSVGPRKLKNTTVFSTDYTPDYRDYSQLSIISHDLQTE